MKRRVARKDTPLPPNTRQRSKSENLLTDRKKTRQKVQREELLSDLRKMGDHDSEKKGNGPKEKDNGNLIDLNTTANVTPNPEISDDESDTSKETIVDEVPDVFVNDGIPKKVAKNVPKKTEVKKKSLTMEDMLAQLIASSEKTREDLMASNEKMKEEFKMKK